MLAAEDPDAAAACADEAAERAGPGTRAAALLARGWVAVRRADRPAALALAAEAAGIARRDADRAALAEALELCGAAEPEPAGARAALVEAQGIWRDAGAPVDRDRVTVALGRLPGAGTDDRIGALLATGRLVAADVLPAGPPDPADGPDPVPVRIRALGRFEVLVAGRPVPASAWQSRKARDLVRVLVARRGRPVPRGELSELLWPDDDPGRTGHRLSVLLSIVRSVLDPAGALPAGHFLIADQASVALDITRVGVDVEEFLADVAHAARLRDRGAPAEARALFADAAQRYTGDAFADEPYAEGTGALREEARAGHLRALRALAALSRDAGDPEATTHHLLRLLDADPYDEAAHRLLVRTLARGGRHGEARRAFDRYAGAMREIGVPGPDPVLLAARPGPPPGRDEPLG